jgi:hypothetical protein
MSRLHAPIPLREVELRTRGISSGHPIEAFPSDAWPSRYLRARPRLSAPAR